MQQGKERKAMQITSGGARGCGKSRVKNGVYACCPFSPDGDGQPVEFFLLDPPQPIDETLVTKIGVTLIERDGITHVLDWVGEKYYVNISDMVEEVRHMGMSRRLELSPEDYAKIGPESRLIMIHKRAIIKNVQQYRPKGDESTYLKYRCTRDALKEDSLVASEHHDGGSVMCSGVWWEDLGNVIVTNGRHGVRQMPSFSYSGQMPPDGVEAKYESGLFAAFPISHLEIVKDDDGDVHKEKLEKMSGIGMEVVVVDA